MRLLTFWSEAADQFVRPGGVVEQVGELAVEERLHVGAPRWPRFAGSSAAVPKFVRKASATACRLAGVGV